MDLQFASAARLELRRAIAWYRQHRPHQLPELRGELTTTFDELSESPLRWPIWRGDHRRRALQRFPYVIIYRVEVDRVIVDAVRHTRRGPDVRFPEDP